MMRRTPLKPSTKPIKRTAFCRIAPDVDKLSVPVKRRMKSSGPRMTKIRASARDEECTLRFPGVCNWRTDTTVLCHSNLLEDGKGAGLKAPDTAAAYGCAACHDTLDGRAPRPKGLTYEAMIELFKKAVTLTHARLRAKGLMK